jgi:NADH-quinone oxidoreductase subunit H
MEIGFSAWNFWLTLILIAAAMGAIQGTCAYLILAERKISAWAQDRLGPNRVGPWGILQPIADGLKFLLKEEIIPHQVDRVFYLLAPAIAVGTATLAFAVVPFGPTREPPQLLDYRTEPAQPIWPQTKSEMEEVLAADRKHAEEKGTRSYPERLDDYNNQVQFVITPHADVGVIFVFAIGSLAVYGIILGGWSSNNKYSFLGSLRSSAQIISYEIPLGLSALGVMLVTGSLNLERIIDYQARHGWNVFFQPVACLIFATSVFAECNRLPFDLPEAEQELVGGYHTEYSGMKFALFFLGEYTHMITTSFLVVIMFFGGWHLPGIATEGDSLSIHDGQVANVGPAILKLLIFAAKMVLFIVFYMLIRWTLPRFRFDQLMGLAWKVLMPLALVNVLCVLCIEHFIPSQSWLMLPVSVALMIGITALTLLMPGAPPRAALQIPGHVSGQPARLRERTPAP